MRDLTLDEILLAKTSFEWHANEGGVNIDSYRADSGRFADSRFQQAVKDCNQKITYCAVGAHHQNGIVEQRIKDLTLISWMLNLHAKHHCPDYDTTMMWPFALEEAAYRLNWLSLRSDGHICEATFFDVDTDFIDPSIYHSFGSPYFVLDSCLQSGVGGAPKWEPVTHYRMQDWLHSFLIQERDMFHHNFMWYLMTTSQRFHFSGEKWGSTS